MFKRQRTGSVICTSCGVLVGVNDDTCYNCGRRNPGLWGYAPALRSLGHDLGFVPFVIGTCGLLYILTLIASGGNIGMRGLFSLFSPSLDAMMLFGASGAIPVFVRDRWWTVFSAPWLHWGLLHLVFNMMAVRQLAPGIAELYGPARTIIIYSCAGVAGFVCSSLAGFLVPPPLQGGIYTAGASASIAGLIGAVFHYGRRGGSGMARSYASTYIVMLVVYGLILPGIDNYAHAGGFGGGYLAALVLDPLKPERVDHMVIALICLALSMLAIVASIVTGLGLL